MANEGFTPLRNGLYMDNKTKKIGKLRPHSEGGYFVDDKWYLKDKNDLPDKIKKDMTASYKKDNRINREIKQYYSMAEDYRKEVLKIERQKAVERRIGGELSQKYRELEDLQTHKERIERDYTNTARKLEDARHRQDMNNEFGISVKKEDVDNLRNKGRIEKVKEGTPLKDMANQRVHDIEETLNNDKILLDYAKRKGLNGINGTSTKELEDRIGQKQKYIRIAKGDDYLKEVDDRINSVETDISPMSEYSDTTGTGYTDRQMKAYKDYLLRTQGTTDEDLINAGREHENRVSIEKFSDIASGKSLNKMSLSELKEMADKYGIKTNMSKAKLISALVSVFNK